MKKRKVFFHCDNALCHRAMKNIAKVYELNFQTQYSPDLGLSDFHPFADVKKVSVYQNRDLDRVESCFIGYSTNF